MHRNLAVQPFHQNGVTVFRRIERLDRDLRHRTFMGETRIHQGVEAQQQPDAADPRENKTHDAVPGAMPEPARQEMRQRRNQHRDAQSHDNGRYDPSRCAHDNLHSWK